MNATAAPRLERSSGSVRLAFKPGPSGTALDRLYQQGCGKVRFPRNDNGRPEAVLLNTSGGLTDGDTLDTEIRWRRTTRATVTTQAAERVYRAASDDVARVSTHLTLENDAVACWLPQETIVFDGARLVRTLDIDLTETSRLVALESTVFGRRAMGETVDRGRITDRWRVRIDDRLVFLDSLSITDRGAGRISDYLDRKAVANSAHCIATMVVAAHDGEAIVGYVRELAPPAGLVVAATRIDRLVVIRMLADDSQAMRSTIGEIVAFLGGILDIELPRVWHC